VSDPTSPMGKLVLMDGHSFVVSNERGDVGPGDPTDGLYFNDTRYLSTLRLSLNGAPLMLLAAEPAESTTCTIHLTNGDLTTSSGTQVLPQTISVRRTRTLADGLSDELELVNYNRFPIPFRLEVAIAADFRDMFEIRGIAHSDPGTIEPAVVGEGAVALRYRGRDAVDRTLRVTSAPPFTADRMSHRHVKQDTHAASLPDQGRPAEPHEYDVLGFRLCLSGTLEPQLPMHATLRLETVETASEADLAGGLSLRGRPAARPAGAPTRISTSNAAFNRLLERGQSDLAMLTWMPATGPVLVAGIPWFACPFGRDSLIASLQTLMVAPDLAAGTLRFLAAHQGRRRDDWRDEEPGKIMHELRFGELARLGAIPQSPYYGSADATPLFLMLLGQAVDWLDDDRLLDELWPSAEAALAWIDDSGDLDGDGLVEYLSRCPVGIRNQGWKDSFDSVTHADGTLAEPPIALIEVQAYAYAAKRAMARLYRRRGDGRRGAELDRSAEELRDRVHARFWLPELATYAQALDRDKHPVVVATSNAAHALYCGLADEPTAARLAARLGQADMLSGWGLRTLSRDAPSYNPMSYHNGSVWPHDSAIAAAGLLRCGQAELGLAIFDQVQQAGQSFRGLRLPELYCGFARDQGAGRAPAAYPVSCSPQAWAAGASFMMLQAALGLEPTEGGRLRVQPRLPDWLDWVQLDDLRVGQRRVGLRVTRLGAGARVDLIAGKIELDQPTDAGSGRPPAPSVGTSGDPRR
jgi:glycogen debranching enzyme